MSQFDSRKPARLGARSRLLRLHAYLLLAAAFGIFVLGHAGWPADVDASEAGAVKDSPDAVTLRVSADENTLEYIGPIVFGVTRRVRAVLDAHPDVTRLRLTSPGGRVVEARDLGEAVAERRLSTVAVGNCASACTVVFMAGRDRLLAASSTLGFHRYHSPDPRQEEAEENMQIDRRYFGARGVPEWFVDRAFTTPNNGMWRPSLEEMKVAHVLTGKLTPEGRRIAFTTDRSPQARADGVARAQSGLAVNASELLP